MLQLYFPGFGWFPYSPDRFHSYISSLNSICNCTYTELHRHICVCAQIGLCRCKYAGVTPKAHSACKAHNLICSRRWWSCINPTTHPLAFCVQSGKFKMADWENSPRLIGPHWGHTLGWQSTDTFAQHIEWLLYSTRQNCCLSTGSNLDNSQGHWSTSGVFTEILKDLHVWNSLFFKLLTGSVWWFMQKLNVCLQTYNCKSWSWNVFK